MLTVEPGLSQDFTEVVALIVAMCVVFLLVVQYVKVIWGIFDEKAPHLGLWDLKGRPSPKVKTSAARIKRI
jgi:hypothetical protein